MTNYQYFLKNIVPDKEKLALYFAQMAEPYSWMEAQLQYENWLDQETELCEKILDERLESDLKLVKEDVEVEAL